MPFTHRKRMTTISVFGMPTQEHDVLAELFRWSPALAADLVGKIGVDLPDVRGASHCSESFTDLKTTEYTGDAAVLLELDSGRCGVVVEVQRRPDKEKPWSWPLYIATLRARERCPVMLLVIAPERSVAEWCATTIETGHPGHTLTPLVLQADNVPELTDPKDFLANPPMGVLSAMFHGDGPEGMKVLRAASDGTDLIADADRQLARRYVDCVLAVVPQAARDALEALMMTESEFYSETFRNAEAKGRAEGRAAAKAEAVLTILQVRGLLLTEEQKKRISGCRDLTQLQTWVACAATVEAADELFG
ncbi:hypothetical protein [Actinoallomurus sp. CA-142502]|uniref:hypothetical protein n=1 Tax=Actinoallomurus sp. CA-142502 TaxID=3239885 RepID=UPI003D91DAC4